MSEEIDPLDFLAVRISRRLEDGSLGFLGVASGVHLRAFRLAQATHCPRLGYVEKGGRYTPGRITITGEPRVGPPPIVMRDLDGMIDQIDWRQDFFDVAMLGGIQIDRHGNVNMIAVGPYEKPRFRGPGTIGAGALAALVHEIHLVSERHDARTLVETVDHCSGFGHEYRGRTRAAVGLRTRGPVVLHTPLATFTFEDGSARLQEVVGSLTLQDIQERTGFEVVPASDGVRQAPAVSDAEHTALTAIAAASRP